MARLDKIHEAVKNALIKDGWKITDDPYTVIYKTQKILVDLAAEKQLFVAEKGTEKIAVEVKSFLLPSKMTDLYAAVGKYEIYRLYLEEIAPERKLFLAVSETVYQEFFTQEAVEIVTEKQMISLLRVDIGKEEIVEWTK